MTVTYSTFVNASHTNGSNKYAIPVSPAAQIDPNISPENWTFTFGEATNSGTNFYFAINRVFLFKGLAESFVVMAGSDPVSTENNNNLCTRELTGGEHMICLECSDSVFAIQPDKIACVSDKVLGMTLGPSKGGLLHSSLKTFCPEGHAYLPLTDGGSCVPCINPDCSRCFKDDLGKCLGCKQDIFRRKDTNDLCTTSACSPT